MDDDRFKKGLKRSDAIFGDNSSKGVNEAGDLARIFHQFRQEEDNI